MEKRLCMPIKSLPACKKQLTRPITEEQSKLILIQQQPGSSSTEQKKIECLYQESFGGL
jgi:hypothetical protein